MTTTPLPRITRHFKRVGKAIRPVGERTVRVTLVSVFVLVLLLEINQIWDGVITGMWDWLWTSILIYRTVNFGLGMLTCYLVMRHRRTLVEGTTRNRIFQTAPIEMDIESLEEHARQHGVELRLRDDPRISKKNPVQEQPVKK